MKSMSSKDRRRHKRVPLLVPITIIRKKDSTPTAARALNLSTGGLFAKVFHSYELGEEVQLDIDFERMKILVEKVELPEDLLKELGKLDGQSAAIRWIEQGSTGAGIEFLDFPKQKYETLQKLVEFVDEKLPSDWDLP